DAWHRALRGPLRAYSATSASAVGHAIDLGDVCVLPVDVTVSQPITRSAGENSPRALQMLDPRVSHAAFRGKSQPLLQHPPPYPRALAPWGGVEGLGGCAALSAFLARPPSLFVFHGPLHAVRDEPVCGREPRVFGAPAVVDDEEDAPRVRLYDASEGSVRPI